jgi:hypothetical protein
MYYIVPKNTVKEHVPQMAVAHWIELPDGDVLLSAAFHTTDRQEKFEAHPQVTSLPHPMSGESVGDKVSAKLAHLGVKAEHRTWDVVKLASKVHSPMKMR